LFIGETHIPNPPYPGLYLFLNTGTPQNAQFTTYSTNLVPGNYHVAVIPTLADIDDDGDQDLFLADGDGNYFYFQNIGNAQQWQFANPVVNWQGIFTNSPTPSCFYDIDNDEDLDLFLFAWFPPSYVWNQVWFYRNNGSPQTPIMVLESREFLNFEIPTKPVGIDIIDIDNDGDGDFFLASGNDAPDGGILFFRNITGESPVNPEPKRPAPTHPVITLLPNPGNSAIAASYKLQAASKVSLKVFDITGRLTGTLFYGFQLPGTYSFSWDAANKAAGVYMLRLEAGAKVEVAKAVVVK
jgi:hypothetical protein